MALARALSLSALVAACGASEPTHVPSRPAVGRTCSSSVGFAFATDGIEVGQRRFELAVFHEPLLAGAAAADGAVVRLRFFRVIEDSSLVVHPNDELRLMQPEQSAEHVPPHARDPMRETHVPFNFFVEVAFDQPGTWGAEVVVSAPWQSGEVFTTIHFPVAPASAATAP